MLQTILLITQKKHDNSTKDFWLNVALNPFLVIPLFVKTDYIVFASLDPGK